MNERLNDVKQWIPLLCDDPRHLPPIALGVQWELRVGVCGENAHPRNPSLSPSLYYAKMGMDRAIQDALITLHNERHGAAEQLCLLDARLALLNGLLGEARLQAQHRRRRHTRHTKLISA